MLAYCVLKYAHSNIACDPIIDAVEGHLRDEAEDTARMLRAMKEHGPGST